MKHKYWMAAAAVVMLAACGSAKAADEGSTTVKAPATTEAPVTTEVPTITEAPTTTAAPTITALVCTPPEVQLNSLTCGVPPTTVPPTTEAPTTTAPCVNGKFDATDTQVCYGGVWVPKPQLTASQKNAVRSAESYLSMMAFSRDGLIDQLSSQYGEQFPIEDATFAVDSLNTDWNAQAAKSAQSYLDIMSFSCHGLIDQLSSQYGEKFTVKQATYGATQVGLCS